MHGLPLVQSEILQGSQAVASELTEELGLSNEMLCCCGLFLPARRSLWQSRGSIRQVASEGPCRRLEQYGYFAVARAGKC